MLTAIFGGSFDPVHNEHVRIAQDALKDYKLDQVIFVPAHQSPYKDAHLSNALDRYNMLKLVCENNPGLVISDVELLRQGLSYTLTTVQDLKPDYVIVGQDAADNFHRWYKSDILKDMIKLIVVPRTVPLSSTQVREIIAQGQSAEHLLPPPVWEYIQGKGLYGIRKDW